MAREVGRRLVHASGSVVPALYAFDVLTRSQFQAVLLAGASLAVVLEVLRLVVGVEWPLFDRLTREYEQDNPAGYALYTVSGAAAGLLFPPPAAVPALFMLTIGDPISGLLGAGELRRVKRSSVLAVMFAVCTLLALPFVPPAAAVAGGLAATVADGVKPVVRGYVVDDNLTIPLVAGGVMTGVLWLLG
ncbi:MAG: dolichol kinase [Haloarculaceae archaeon]